MRSLPLILILVAAKVMAADPAAPATTPAPLNVPDLIAQARKLASAAPDASSAARLAPLQDLSHRLLGHPTASFSQDAAWMPFVENVAVASFRSATEFAPSREIVLSWIQSIQGAQIGSRSERATLCVRIWKRFLSEWEPRSPDDVRAALNHPPIDLQWGVTRAEQESCQFVIMGLRTSLLDDALAGSGDARPDAAAIRQEFEQCLKTALPEAKAAAIAHYARLLYASGEAKQGLAELAAHWTEILKTDSSPKLLSAAFFINWYGLGDRESARKILAYSDTLCAKGAVSATSSDLVAMRQAYYRGLPLTADELIFLNRKPSPTTTSTH